MIQPWFKEGSQKSDGSCWVVKKIWFRPQMDKQQINLATNHCVHLKKNWLWDFLNIDVNMCTATTAQPVQYKTSKTMWLAVHAIMPTCINVNTFDASIFSKIGVCLKIGSMTSHTAF